MHFALIDACGRIDKCPSRRCLEGDGCDDFCLSCVSSPQRYFLLLIDNQNRQHVSWEGLGPCVSCLCVSSQFPWPALEWAAKAVEPPTACLVGNPLWQLPLVAGQWEAREREAAPTARSHDAQHWHWQRSPWSVPLDPGVRVVQVGLNSWLSISRVTHPWELATAKAGMYRAVLCSLVVPC